ncbi:glycosyltransferase [Peterkaempfera bronchialis]|uniref:glycosyltransferase n=1 Tax=Peterkaempfera bronchialis TaxID=2126346 RepID=UPI003C303CE3
MDEVLLDVLMLVTTDVAHDSRVVREAAALAGAGHTVHVQGREVPAGWAPPGGLFTVGSSSGGRGLRPPRAPGLGGQPQGDRVGEAPEAVRRGPGWLWRAVRWWLLPRHRRQVWAAWSRAAVAELRERRFDVVHAHDFNTLPTAARLAREYGALLVYDSHEWWSGRQRHGRPAPLERLRDRRLEVELTGRADAVVTVGEGIAGRLERWATGPVTVVRNTFPALPPATGAEEVPLPSAPKGMVYAGRIGAGRDLETVLAGAAAQQSAVVLVGPADEAYAARLARAEGGDLELLAPRPVDAVDGLLRRYGLAVVALTDSCENHRLALPNKLFHAVRAGVPVVAADLPELRGTVLRYDLGELYRPGDPGSFRAAVDRVEGRYPELLRSVAAARAELAWEQDARRLVALYGTLAAARQSPGEPPVDRPAASRRAASRRATARREGARPPAGDRA